MSTPKEIFLELLRPDGQPERQLRQYEALAMYLADPINVFLRGNRKRGTTSVDRWGVTIDFPEDAPGPIPVHTGGLTVCPDVTRWREVVHAPDLQANCARGGRRPGPPPTPPRERPPGHRLYGHRHLRAVPLPHGF